MSNMKAFYVVQFSPKIGSKYLTVFKPDQDLCCNPPYVKGKIDQEWQRKISKKNIYNKEVCEKIIGLKLQPLGYDDF